MLHDKAWFMEHFLKASRFYAWVCVAPNCYTTVKLDRATAADLLDKFEDEEHKFGFFISGDNSLYIGQGPV